MEATIIEAEVIEALRSCFDPEIPVNIYELGLIYDVKVDPSRPGGYRGATGSGLALQHPAYIKLLRCREPQFRVQYTAIDKSHETDANSGALII